MLKELNLDVVKKVIKNHYLDDINFPRSCGSISMILTVIFQDSNLKDKYDISYVRGHFRNDYQEEYCECEFIYYDKYDRFSNLDNFDCSNCTCDYMTGHSWIELRNKSTDEVVIVDFTNIQFEEDFPDYQSEILESNYAFNTNEIFEYLKERSEFIIDKNHRYFNHYIVSKKVCSGEYALNKTKEVIKKNKESGVTIILNNIGYKLSI